MKKMYFGVLLFILFFIDINQVHANVKINCNGGIKIGVNQTYTLTASDDVSWSSSNSDIASIDEDSGELTAHAVGSTIISAVDDYSSDTCKVTVFEKYVRVSSINTPRSKDTLNVGESKNIGATVSPSNATEDIITYKSNNTSIVKVDSNGNITGVGGGSTTINLSCGEKSINYPVEVISNIKLTSISVKENYELTEGDSDKIAVTYTPSNATNKSLTWKSSNTGVVTVDSNGNIKAVAAGTATITLTSSDGNHVATTKITVNAIDKSLKGISLNKNELKIEVGNTETLTVSFNPSNAENKQVIWSSSNNEVATVTDGKITAIKPGIIEIKATSQEGNFEAKCKVTIPSPPIESIKFANEIEEMYIGTTKILDTISEPADSIIMEPVWTSSDEIIATVDEYGQITAISIGTTTITVSDKEGKITASTTLNVIEPPLENIIINIEGYDIGFNPDVKEYSLKIKKETSLNITTNADPSKVVIAGNRDLQNGSVVTVTITNGSEKLVYVFNIRKAELFNLPFIIIISIILVINIIRMAINSKKNKNR